MKRIWMTGITYTVGGVESYIMNILRNISSEDFQFYFPKWNDRCIAYEQEIRSMGNIIVENCPRRHEVGRYFPFYKRLFETYKFDAVYYNTCDIMSMDPLIFAKQAGVPIRIIHSHCSENMIHQTLYHKLSEKWCRANLHKYATSYLACGEQAGKWMFDEHPFTVIKNGISVEKFKFYEEKRIEVRKEFGIDSQFVVGFVGRLTPQKKPQFLVDVFDNLVKKRPDSVLLIIGDGELRRETEAKIEEYGLQGKVRMLGTRSDVADLMCAMDCFCLPSDYEGFPFVLVEAQANGLPCVVSKSVSEECNLTGTMQFIGFDEPLAKWGNAINNTIMPIPREQYADVIRNMGYDMKSEIKKIERIMSGEF